MKVSRTEFPIATFRLQTLDQPIFQLHMNLETNQSKICFHLSKTKIVYVEKTGKFNHCTVQVNVRGFFNRASPSVVWPSACCITAGLIQCKSAKVILTSFCLPRCKGKSGSISQLLMILIKGFLQQFGKLLFLLKSIFRNLNSNPNAMNRRLEIEPL